MKTKLNKKAVIWTIAISVVLIAIVVGYYVWVRKKSVSNSNVGLGGLDDGVLRYGSRGADVETLQAYLNAKLTFYYYERGERPTYNGSTLNSLVVDGIFGAKTLCAVKWWFGKETVSKNELN